VFWYLLGPHRTHRNQRLARKIARAQAKVDKAQARLARLQGAWTPASGPRIRPYFWTGRGLLRGILWAGLYAIERFGKTLGTIDSKFPQPAAKALPESHDRGFWTFGRRTRSR
jgi:hypothetical protein